MRLTNWDCRERESRNKEKEKGNETRNREHVYLTERGTRNRKRKKQMGGNEKNNEKKKTRGKTLGSMFALGDSNTVCQGASA